MSERQDSLQQYVSDMPALESQSKADRYAKHPEARRVVNKIEAIIRSHIDGLEQHLKSLGETPHPRSRAR